MKKTLDLSAAELEAQLLHYHQDLTVRIRRKYHLPKLADVKYIAARKKSVLGIYGLTMSAWEKFAFDKYGNDHAWKSHYAFMVEISDKDVVPHMEADYNCSIERHILFTPHYENDTVYSLSVTHFTNPIFKGRNGHLGEQERKIAEIFSVAFRRQNKRGPEQVSATIFNDQFLSLFAKGLLTPFTSFYVNSHPEAAKVCTEMMRALLETILAEIHETCFTTAPGKFFLHYDMQKDELFVLSFLDKDNWPAFFSAVMHD